MEPVVLDLLPEAGVEDKSRGIFEVVLHHFGHTRRARGEVAEHRLVAGRTGECGELVAHLAVALVKATVTLHRLGEQALLERGALVEGVGDVLDDIRFRRRDEQLDIRGVAAVDDVLGGEQVGCGDDDRAQLAAGGDQHPVFPATVEHAHDVVAAFYARGEQEIDHAVALLRELAEGDDFLLAFGVAPDESPLFGGYSRIFVHDVVREIEALGDGELHILCEIFIVRKVRTVEKFVKKVHTLFLRISFYTAKNNST